MQQLRISPSGPVAENFAYGPLVDNGLSAALGPTTIDWSSSYAQKVTLNANTALALYHGWASGKVARGVLFVHAGAGGFTPTLPAILTPGGTPLAFSTAAGALNIVDLLFNGSQLSATLRGAAFS